MLCRNQTAALVWLALAVVVLVGCPKQQAADQTPAAPPAVTQEHSEEEGGQMDWKLTSPAFAHGERIPAKYTADGEDISPPLQWTDPPEGTVELALVCHDPDAPRAGGWTHWVLYGLSPEVRELPERMPTTEVVDKPACRQGHNSWPTVGYKGPSPPPGTGVHRYQFTLYALATRLSFPKPPDRDALLKAIKDHTLAETMLEGTYSR